MVRRILLLQLVCAVACGLRVGSVTGLHAARSARAVSMQLVPSVSGQRMLVLGGGGFAGREVCKNAVAQGYKVTSLTRRGENPEPDCELLRQVQWRSGDALDPKTVKKLVDDADAVCHAIGILFDVDTGFLKNLSPIVSGSNSQPGPESTYDNMTRKTAFIAIQAIKNRIRLPFGAPMPFGFISCAEAGWPDVTFGEQVESVAPEWLKKYLTAKRQVEAELNACEQIKPVIVRPSFIWTWSKLDILPVIPIFTIAAAAGVPFVDKPVRVETLGKAMVAGMRDPGFRGVARVDKMEELAGEL